MSDWVEVDGKKYYEEGYLKLANANSKRAREMFVSVLPFFEAIRDCGQPAEWEESNPVLDYVTVQIDKPQWELCKKALESLKSRFNV